MELSSIGILLLAATFAFLWFRAQTSLQSKQEELSTSAAEFAAKCEIIRGLEAADKDLRSRIVTSEENLRQLREEHSLDARSLAAKAEAVDRLSQDVSEKTDRMMAAEAALLEATRENAQLKEALARESKASEEKLGLLKGAQDDLRQQFTLLSNDVLTTHGKTFKEQNREQLNTILDPLQKDIIDFKRAMSESDRENAKERTALKTQIERLSEESGRLSTDATNLARALRGDSQTQGAWGEMILESILERSGLREGQEYSAQESHTSEDGLRRRTDIVINLPGNERVVIDSKVSLKAFDDFINASTEEIREDSLLRHVQSLKNHVKTLGSKEYHAAVGSTLDYVIMFVPIEGALAAALTHDPSLTSFAVDRNVAIATPTTLMLALRTIHNVWQVEKRNQNAEQIALRAGSLYDKFVAFIADLEKLGKRLADAQGCFDATMGKLSTENGNLVRQATQLKKLGAKTNKSLPLQLVQASETEELATKFLTESGD